MNTPTLLLWIYIALLVIGGLIGFLKAGSRISLIMSAVFAVLLALCALKVFPVPWLSEILLATLLAVFSIRLFKTGKFMPSGLMLLLTAAILLLRLWLTA
jgi:uncharacterized membrane protein (UPF0136 family)